MRPFLFLLALSVAPLAWAGDVIEGLWDIGLVLRVEGQDYGPHHRRQCITQADAQDPGKLFGESTGICQFVNKRYFGTQLTFNVRCDGGVPLTGTGQVEFGPERFYGNLALIARMPEGPSVETLSEISGKRLGPCPQ
jgi:hypothetical protein